MLDFSSYIDLPLIWGGIIATAVFLYVLLDGFDLGVGIIFPFAPSDNCRSRMMNSIAPFWDGNETWLVMGGGGLFAAFPLAYSVLLPAFYIPIITMLLCLVLRGVAFEFRFKASEKSVHIWDHVFHFGSLGAALCQGVILGAFVQGVKVDGKNFGGGYLDWAEGFSVMTGVALVFGYALLGATWLIMKSDGITQEWARKIASYLLKMVLLFMGIVALTMPLATPKIGEFWFSYPQIYYFICIAVALLVIFAFLWLDLSNKKREVRPFFMSVSIFFVCYIALLASIFPWIVPFEFDLWEAAASSPGLSLLLAGTIPLLPLILGYSGYCYYVFRGKIGHEKMY